MRLSGRLILALVALVATPTAVSAEKRVALVIGNSLYQHTPVLKNPGNDAVDIAAALKRLNFEVLDGFDLDKRNMDITIRKFALALRDAEVALFFYAGHGLQVNGQNYLVPIDAKLDDVSGLDFEMVRVDVIHRAMERQTSTNVLFLDACRDNPLARNLARAMGTRSAEIGRGLAPVESGMGTLISFSTQPGNVALDGEGRNSPFASALVRHMRAEGEDLSSILISVRNDVMGATRNRQIPWEHSALRARFFFKATPAPPKAHNAELELAFWNAAQAGGNIGAFSAYLERYPEGVYASSARLMIDKLKQVEASRAGLDAREADLRKIEEAERLKAIEAAKLATKMASLPQGTDSSPTPQGRDPVSLARSLQSELKRVGCDPGPVDGNWRPKATNALRDFTRITKRSLTEETPTEAALAAVTAQREPVCKLTCASSETEVNGKCVTKVRREASKPKVAAQPAKRSNDEDKASTKLCWSNMVGGSGSLVPCSDGRAVGR